MITIKKFSATVMMAAALLSSLGFSSCKEGEDDTPTPPVTPGTQDTQPWPFDVCIDSTVVPGDNFYAYISMGYASKFGKGIFEQTVAASEKFVTDEYANPTSTPLKTLNKWSEVSNEDIHTREISALNTYITSLKGKTNKELVQMLIHNNACECYPIIKTTNIIKGRESKILPYLQWYLPVSDEDLAAMAQYTGFGTEILQPLYTNCKLLYTEFKQFISTTNGLSIADEVKMSRLDPSYVPQYLSAQEDNKVKTRAAATLDENEQLLLEGLELNQDDIDLIYKDPSAYSNLISFIKDLRNSKDEAKCNEILMSYLIVSRIQLSYDLTATTQDSPNVNIKKFMGATFCQQLMSDEYITQNITTDDVKACEELATQLRNTFDSRLDSLDWMSPTTKAYAKYKLKNMYFWFGVPKSPVSSFEITIDAEKDMSSCPSDTYLTLADRYYNNIMIPHMRTEGFDDDKIYTLFCSIGTPSYTANAFYYVLCNSMNILAIDLKAPMSRRDVSLAYNYGSIGYVVGHEMCHGFDANGSQYDENGNVANWWAVSDALKYKEKQNALINLYNQYKFTDHKGNICQVDGSKTLTENMADFGGMTVALDALCRLRRSQGYDEQGVREQARRFFLTEAMEWANETPYYNRYYEKPTDNHSPMCIRACIGNLLDEWYDIFNVKYGDKYYLEPSQRIKLW